MTKGRIATAVAVAVVAAAVLWWLHGGQHWLAIHTGTDYCQVQTTVCRSYGFWSGFGSDLGEYVIITSLIGSFTLHWRAHTCQYSWWCWRRPHYQVAGTPHMVCGWHHPHDQVGVREAVAAEMAKASSG